MESNIGNAIHILNVILNYFYLGLLIMCFLLSLGNRPQGSKWGYTLAMIGFAVITVYMTVCIYRLYTFRHRILTCNGRLVRRLLPRSQGYWESWEIWRDAHTVRSFHQLHLPEYRHIIAGYNRTLSHCVAHLRKSVLYTAWCITDSLAEVWAVAYDHLVLSIYSPGSILYQRTECVRCTSLSVSLWDLIWNYHLWFSLQTSSMCSSFHTESSLCELIVFEI